MQCYASILNTLSTTHIYKLANQINCTTAVDVGTGNISFSCTRTAALCSYGKLNEMSTIVLDQAWRK